MSDSGAHENDVAIVGISLRVPGAQNPSQFWENLRDGVESVRQLSEEELLEAGESPDLLRHPDYVRACGPLDGMDLFDGEFFGFSPKESAILDPQHRHFTECCWEALEDAGHPPEKFDGPIGLFGGCGMGSYFYFNVCRNKELVDSVGMFLLRHTGNDKDFLVTRVSYLLDLKGPSVGVQTACSTSLVATHMACQSLLAGESDMALAGGVTIVFPHNRGYVYHDGEVLSPDGHCHAFDHRAQGTVLTSGAAVVVLRRLEDALADGDHVYAVIRGTAVNNDGGQKVGYLAPSVDGQTAAMVEAHSVAEVDPSTIGMIECHGTGTYMGDPIEITALTEAFRRQTEEKGFCRIGSVKTNIGHLDTAAGTAGLIKAALSLENEAIPASLGYERPNPVIPFEDTPFVVNDELKPWPRTSTPRRAAVNSLGVGGTNAHAVIEEAPVAPKTSESARPFQLLQLSARNHKALDGNAKRLAAWLREHPDTPLADVAYTLDVGRRAFDRRRVIAAASHDEAIEYLESGDPRRAFTHGVPNAPASVAFMFSGAGAQYPRMAAELYEHEPVFREHLDRGLERLEQKTGFDFRQIFFAPNDRLEDATREIDRLNRMLASIFVVEYALAQLWRSWGIEPDVMIGHSMGENTAACIAGVMSFEDCLDLVILRGQLTDETAPGAMLSVALSPDELEPYLGDDVDLAVVNGPELCVASGAADAIDDLEKRLGEADVQVSRVAMVRAGHSRLFDPILPTFRRFMESIELHPPQIPFVSNRTGKLITAEQATDPGYWVDHLRHTVHFADGLGTILEEPGRVLIEVGPGQTLCSVARQHPAARNANVIPSMRHRDDSISDAALFLASVGRCWASGLSPHLERLREGEVRRRVSLPTYAWCHQPYFVEPSEPQDRSEDLTHLERLKDVTDFGSRPVWERSTLPARAESKPQTWLLFMDEAGVGQRLRKRLSARGHTVIAVFAGDAFYKRSDDEYSLAPERGRAGYDALVQDLVSSGRVPGQIVHLWLVTTHERFRPGSSFFHQNLQDGFYSLYFLAQALADENVPRPLQISVVTNGMQAVDEDDALLFPEKSTVLGPVKVIPRELPGVTCKSIDVQLPHKAENTLRGLLETISRSGRSDGEGVEAIADTLETELQGAFESEVVAHRRGERFRRTFEKLPLAPRPAAIVGEAPALRQGGTYLVTGGLGGLGLNLAERLARELQAKLVLVGRTGLPDRRDWDAWLASRGESDRVSRRIRRIQEIEQLGAEVMVAEADVTNLEQMRGVVQRARQRFGVVHGFFHTAGTVKDELIQLKLEADIEDVFSPKIHGTVVLDALLEEAGAELFVLYSSTSAIAAPAGQIDYVAANAFLDAYAQSRAKGPVRTVSINWGIWNGVGMGADSFENGSTAAERDAPPETPRYAMFDARVKDSHGRTTFTKNWSTAKDWLLDEHRTAQGHALLPGTGYPELAWAALREYGDEEAFEIRDLYFIRPLYVPDGQSRDVRVMLQGSERGYRFEVRTSCRLDGRPAWELNAQASIELGHLERPEKLDLGPVWERCHKSRSGDHPEGLRSGQENHVAFGPRWRVLRQLNYGSGEAVARLQLPDAYVDDLDAFGLHPALLDYATGYAMDLIDGYRGDDLWVPVSYGSIAVFGVLPQRIQSWVRNRGKNTNDAEFAVFDVTITDEDGNVIVDIQEFTIKRLTESVDFAVVSEPSRSDVEFEAALGSGDARNLSPAELQLRRNYERGIRPEEGPEALMRVLAAEPLPQVAISSLDLEAMVRQVERTAEESTAPGTKFDRPDLDSEYVEPADELERTLVGYWEELLGVEKLGVADSFFELGGHSLIAVRLFARIKKAYQVDFPISVLFEAPTIRGCAQLIREAGGAAGTEREGGKAPASETRRTRYKHLVAMHSGEGGRRAPFFLVAGMFGNVLNLRHLANLVGTDRRFYGLQARGLYGDEPPHETFEEMAEAYIEEIRSVQPHGPYLIGGFSGGGITAFEIAHQLRAAGEEIGLLLLLDSRLPQTPNLTFADRAQVQLQRLRRRGAGYLVDYVRNRAKWEMEKIRRRFEVEETSHTEDQFHNEAIERAFRAALPRYEMRRYPGKLVLFRPKLDEAYVLGPGRVLDSAKEWVSNDNAFGDYCESIEVFEMPGNHDSMVLEPNVRVMASQLRACIAEAEASSGE